MLLSWEKHNCSNIVFFSSRNSQHYPFHQESHPLLCPAVCCLSPAEMYNRVTQPTGWGIQLSRNARLGKVRKCQHGRIHSPAEAIYSAGHHGLLMEGRLNVNAIRVPDPMRQRESQKPLTSMQSRTKSLILAAYFPSHLHDLHSWQPRYSQETRILLLIDPPQPLMKHKKTHKRTHTWCVPQISSREISGASFHGDASKLLPTSCTPIFLC